MNERGGARKGCGRKPLYNEPTKFIGFKVPISKEAEIRKKIIKILKTYQIK